MAREYVTYRELADRWRALRGSRGARVREVACVGAPRTLLCIEYGNVHRPAISLSAGVHGDEPAGPLALLELVERDLLDATYSYRIWPCTNPTGFDAETRENADGVDVNRTFGRGGGSPEARAIVTVNRDLKFVLSIDLHEDRDATGFYCYEYGGAELGRHVVEALDAGARPIESFETLSLGGPLLDALVVKERGRVSADPFEEAHHLKGLSYSLLLARNAAQYVLTFETPGALPLQDRVEMHVDAVRAAIGGLSQTTQK
jgi:murein peptide amidase A